jgi:hypothetical protein
MSSMLMCSAGARDAASAMVQARECGEYRNLATRLNTVNPRQTARMDLNKHEHAGYKSMINRIQLRPKVFSPSIFAILRSNTEHCRAISCINV